jgi:hypothetical protein
MKKYTTIDDVNKLTNAFLKFVIVNNELRFIDGSFGSHCEIVDQKTEKATDAGTLAVFDNYCRIQDTGSMTLQIRGLSQEGEDLLRAGLNRPLKDQYDY